MVRKSAFLLVLLVAAPLLWAQLSEQTIAPRGVGGYGNLTTPGAIPFVASVPGAVTFTGKGLNDMAVGGVYIGAAAATYCLVPDSAGKPDTFSWGTNAGCDSGAKAVAMTGAAQALSYGITVTFKATTGHTVGEKWAFSVAAPAGGLAQDPTGLAYNPATKTVAANVLGNAGTVTDISDHASTELSDSDTLVRGGGSLTDTGTPVAVGPPGTISPFLTIPAWRIYSLVAVGTGMNGCDNASISEAVFGGQGLDDATSGGAYTGTGGAVYTVVIDGTGLIGEHTLGAGGADYVVDETFTVDTGFVLATGKVTEVDELGAVTAYTLLTPGQSYTIQNGVGTTSTSGDGTGLTIDITLVLDSFKWERDGGDFTEGVLLTGEAQELANGVTIAFDDIFGHARDDYWTITVTDLGCWAVNGVVVADKADGVMQDVPLFELPMGGHVTDWRIKTAVACTGTTTAETGLGTAGQNVLFRVHTYNIQAEVANTNMANGPTAGTGSHTLAATNIVASLVTTMEPISALVVGCAVDYWLLWAVLP